jgi:hypothetical protein
MFIFYAAGVGAGRGRNEYLGEWVCLDWSLDGDCLMPTTLQYPLERSRALEQKWARLRHRGVSTIMGVWGQQENGALSQAHKTPGFASTQNVRLDELLARFGCRDEIAPFDDAFAVRAGELIAKANSPLR